ncbi:hypothetical protein K469DRAFT_785933 [Zopfia rhizophila CBS 207.26]|uniref:Uncharacterized protein n=1 Tax=Zopfia rhizophila CBS 207.26 TaxID=1314779 RepID=A0A6A6DZE2_9PEZI|nr:hypothetical protein K469DRAFT_785933 [Zopfia rhizophila CBS 207.26]
MVNNLSNFYVKQDKLGEAEKMYQRALRGMKAFGPEHASTLGTVNNLGNLYAKPGKLGEAEEMYQRTLQEGSRHSVRGMHQHSTRSTTRAIFTRTRAI